MTAAAPPRTTRARRITSTAIATRMPPPRPARCLSACLPQCFRFAADLARAPGQHAHPSTSPRRIATRATWMFARTDRLLLDGDSRCRGRLGLRLQLRWVGEHTVRGRRSPLLHRPARDLCWHRALHGGACMWRIGCRESLHTQPPDGPVLVRRERCGSGGLPLKRVTPRMRESRGRCLIHWPRVASH